MTTSDIVTTSIGNAGTAVTANHRDRRMGRSDRLIRCCDGEPLIGAERHIVLAEEQDRRCTGILNGELAGDLGAEHQPAEMDRPPVEAIRWSDLPSETSLGPQGRRRSGRPRSD